MLFLLASLALAKKPVAPPPPTLADVGADLLGRALVDDRPFEDLVWLADRIGPRPNGSPGLAAAVVWGKDAMTKAGLDAHTEDVTLPTWSRGEATASLVSPVARDLHPLALGGSVGSGGAIEADVLVVSSWAELGAHADRAKGRIIVWDVPFAGYGETVGYRFAGAIEAAKVGGVASLVRSISPTSLQTPHTGAQATYDEALPKIPALAITIEDATLLHRLQDRGVTPRIRLNNTSAEGAEAPSANVVGRLAGRELPKERVILGCHLDSWDVGTGAQDDGAGCAIALGAARLIAEQPVKPRRSIEVVFFVGEEYRVAGAEAFAAAHQADADSIVAAIEVDTGSGQPLGFGMVFESADEHPLGADDPRVTRAIALLRPASELLVPIGAGSLELGHAGTDVEQLVPFGVPAMGLHQDLTNYWPIHHTAADTVDKVDPVLLARNTATLAVMAWAIADMPERIGQ